MGDKCLHLKSVKHIDFGTRDLSPKEFSLLCKLIINHFAEIKEAIDLKWSNIFFTNPSKAPSNQSWSKKRVSKIVDLSQTQYILQIKKNNRGSCENRKNFESEQEQESNNNITFNLNERSEITIKNKSQLKIDSKKNLFLVQFFTDPKEFYFNFKSGAIIQKNKEVEESNNEEIYLNEQKAWRKTLQSIKDFISSIGSAISDIMKGMCCFKNKIELLSFVVYSKDENPVNFAQLNLFFLIFFTLDLFLCSFVPLFFHSAECGKGMEWGAHYFMGSYFLLTVVIEYFYVQYLYSKICQPRKWYRFYNPIKSCIFSMLAKMDIYTDVCMTVEIYKCQSEPNSRDYFLFLFAFSFVVFCVSMLYQTWCFIRMIIGRQPKSTFNPLYSNTSSLAYSASFKCLGEFIDRFCIPYYGHISDHFNAKKALAFIKLIVEDCMQCLIQILFLCRRNLTDGVYFQILISLSLSAFSALTAIAVIFGDVTSPLSSEDQKSLTNEFKHLEYGSSDNANALEAVDLPIPMQN